MKRYGDNLPSSAHLENELNNAHRGSVQVMYGGCGVRFGTFTQPVPPAKESKTLDVFSLLGFKRRKRKEADSGD